MNRYSCKIEVEILAVSEKDARKLICTMHNVSDDQVTLDKIKVGC